MSNQKQLGLGVMQYAQDYDDTLPVIGTSCQCRGRWQWQIYSYVKNEQVFTCPDLADNPWKTTTSVVTGCASPCGTAPLGTHDKGGYGMNNALSQDTSGQTNASLAPGFPLGSIRKPSETILIGDTGFLANSTAAAGWAMAAADPRNTTVSATYSQPGLYPQFRHPANTTITTTGANKLPIDGRANFIFLDGHVKNLDIATAMQKATAEDGNTLRAESSPGTTFPNSQYLLWNIY